MRVSFRKHGSLVVPTVCRLVRTAIGPSKAGNALKSKVASVFPAGGCVSFKWRRLRRMSLSASPYSASTARKRAAGQPLISARAAISGQSLWKPQRRQHAGQILRLDHHLDDQNIAKSLAQTSTAIIPWGFLPAYGSAYSCENALYGSVLLPKKSRSMKH
jgi:hypothetical protein